MNYSDSKNRAKFSKVRSGVTAMAVSLTSRPSQHKLNDFLHYSAGIDDPTSGRVGAKRRESQNSSNSDLSTVELALMITGATLAIIILVTVMFTVFRWRRNRTTTTDSPVTTIVKTGKYCWFMAAMLVGFNERFFYWFTFSYMNQHGRYALRYVKFS